MTSAPQSPKGPFAYIDAYPIALLGSAVSSQANTLVERLLHHVVRGDSEKRRPTSIEKSRRALGALLADLFDLQRGYPDDPRPRRAAHGMSPKDFHSSSLGFGRGIFTEVLSSLQDLGLVSVAVGQPRWQKAFGKVHNFNGQTTTIQATPELIRLASSMGVEVMDWPEHWCSTDGRRVASEPAAPLLELRGAKPRIRGKKQDGPVLCVDQHDPRVKELQQGLDRLNGFLLQQQIGGIAFPGLRRIFSDGDQPEFTWNKGGRYYSLPGGHRYETLSADRRFERLKFNGERVGEADIRASHMTLLHALMDRPFDLSDDPYHVEELKNRDLVKWWCTQAIGSSNPSPRQWASDKKLMYSLRHQGRELQQDYPIAKVGEAVRARHPLLSELRTCGISTLDLQYHEAQLLGVAMEQLMQAAVTVLPIHDGLIVAQQHLRLAEEALIEAFREYVGGVIGHPPLVIPQVVSKVPNDRSAPE